MKWKIPLIILLVFLLAQSAFADREYRWKDDTGTVQLTLTVDSSGNLTLNSSGTGATLDFDDLDITGSGSFTMSGTPTWSLAVNQTLDDDTGDSPKWQVKDATNTVGGFYKVDGSHAVIETDTAGDGVAFFASGDSDDYPYFDTVSNIVYLKTAGTVDFWLAPDTGIAYVSGGTTLDAILEVRGGEAKEARVIWAADEDDDATDQWQADVDTSGNWSLGNDTVADTFTDMFVLDTSGNAALTGDLTVTGNDINLGSITTGVKLTSDGDGAITFLGMSAGSDEDIKFNLDDTSNEVTVSSSTGVTTFNLSGAIDLSVGGGDITAQSATASKSVLWLENIADDATAPSIILENDRATEADGDDCGTIYFRASDDGDATFDAATILVEATDITATKEAGSMIIDVEINDVATEMLKMRGDAGDVSTGHFEINSDAADIDLHYDGNTTADYLLIDATVESTKLTSSLTTMPLLHMENTTDDATCPVIRMENDRATEADGDDLGRISFYGSDDGDAASEFAYILVEATDITATQEAASVEISLEINDTDTNMVKFLGDAGDVTTGSIEFNMDAADVDIHIDGDDQADLVKIDAGTDTITFNVGQADSQFVVNQDAVAGTEGAPLVLIDDERTGATANSAGEAALMIDPEGTHAINVVDGISYFGGMAEFNAGVYEKDVVVTDAAAYTVLTANSGKKHVIADLAQNTSIDLPAEADGLNYEFWYVGGAAEAHDHTIDSENDTNYFIGGVGFHDTDDGSVAAVFSDGNSNSKLTINNASGGTFIKVTCDGTNWYVTGTVVSDTAPAFADQ